MIIIHFMIFEQEPMLRVIIVYGGHSSTNRMLVSVSILILSSDSLINNGVYRGLLLPSFAITLRMFTAFLLYQVLL